MTGYGGNDLDPCVARRAFGQRVRELRAEHGISQDALARATGIDPTAIGRLERGSREPRLTTILRIARGLGVQPGALTNDLAAESATSLERPVSAGVPLQYGSS